jgi:hypothetical protein
MEGDDRTLEDDGEVMQSGQVEAESVDLAAPADVVASGEAEIPESKKEKKKNKKKAKKEKKRSASGSSKGSSAASTPRSAEDKDQKDKEKIDDEVEGEDLPEDQDEDEDEDDFVVALPPIIYIFCFYYLNNDLL